MQLSIRLTLFFVSLFFLTGLFLRVYDLGNIPVSLTIDEVAVGYNAYSILKTGRDEHGTVFPLAFKSIGDYKAPLLIYSMIPAIHFVGLNEFGVRITTALFGSLTVLAVFLLALEFTRNRFIAVFTAFSLAISPWHIKFSRSSFEAVLALLLVILGVYLFVKAVNRKGNFLWVSAILFSLSMYAYHAERIFTPILILLLMFIYHKELLLLKKRTIIALIIGLISFIPLFITLLSPQTRIRGEVTFISRDVEINDELHKEGEKRDIVSYIIDNNFLLTFNFWTKRYLEYFDPNFLFIKGMGYSLPKTPDIGLLYLIELPFVALGLFLVFFKNYVLEKKIRFLALGWFLLGILAASLANNAQHPLRALTWIPIPQFLSAVGLFYLVKKLKYFYFKMFVLGCYMIVICASLIYFWVLYAFVYQYLYSEGAMDGWKEASKYAIKNQYKYKEIVIDARFGTAGLNTVGIPYAYVLFYGQIDPSEFQSDPRRKESDGSINFRNFTFREIKWGGEEDSDRNHKDNLYIGSEWVLPFIDDITHKKFYLLNGKEILRAVSSK